MCVTVFESAMKINLPLVLCHHGPFKKKYCSARCPLVLAWTSSDVFSSKSFRNGFWTFSTFKHEVKMTMNSLNKSLRLIIALSEHATTVIEFFTLYSSMKTQIVAII